MHQILLRPEVSLGRLNRSVTEEQLNLLKLASGGPAELGTGTAKIMRR